MILGRFLGGYIAASPGHGKEAHENRTGPPNQVQVNALILWQLLYVHYAARYGWYSVLCVSSVQIENFKRSNLCEIALFSMFHSLSFFVCSGRTWIGQWRDGQIKCSTRGTYSCCFIIIWPSERFQSWMVLFDLLLFQFLGSQFLGIVSWMSELVAFQFI